MTIKLFTTFAAAIVAYTVPAMAGTPAPAPADPVIPAPVPVIEEWTGPYVGIQLGFGDVTAATVNANLSDNGMLYGVTIGYDRDFGNWVLGAAIDYDMTDINVGGIDVESVARLKLRAGPDLGRTLPYVVVGAARASTDLIGSDTGWAAGLGLEQRLNDNWSIGGEALYHSFDNFNGTGIDIEATTVAIRALYRF